MRVESSATVGNAANGSATRSQSSSMRFPSTSTAPGWTSDAAVVAVEACLEPVAVAVGVDRVRSVAVLVDAVAGPVERARLDRAVEVVAVERLVEAVAVTVGLQVRDDWRSSHSNGCRCRR